MENKSIEGKKWTTGRMTKKVERMECENAQYRVIQHGMDEMPHEFTTCDFPVLKQAPHHEGVRGGI